MAQQLYQLSDVQEAFAARVQAKVQDRREQTQDKAEDVPLIGWLLRPLAGWAFDSREHSNTRLGERGEEAVSTVCAAGRRLKRGGRRQEAAARQCACGRPVKRRGFPVVRSA